MCSHKNNPVNTTYLLFSNYRGNNAYFVPNYRSNYLFRTITIPIYSTGNQKSASENHTYNDINIASLNHFHSNLLSFEMDPCDICKTQKVTVEMMAIPPVSLFFLQSA